MEIDLVLEALYRRHGYDFRHYARASLTRRLLQRVEAAKLPSIGHMVPLILHDETFIDDLLTDLSVSVTSFFRDPAVFRVLRERVVPILKTYPYIKIWHAGCSTGEEVYSMAILLYEEGLLSRTQIYATDFNRRSLTTAREAIYSEEAVAASENNYVRAGGSSQWHSYYHASYDAAMFHGFLRDAVTFAYHNLAIDQVFGDMNLILCRNVMIYFDLQLQNQVLKLLRDSLCPRGFLCLGARESIEFSASARTFEAVDAKARIFRLRRGEVTL